MELDLELRVISDAELNHTRAALLLPFAQHHLLFRREKADSTPCSPRYRMDRPSPIPTWPEPRPT
ncbi:hypothetical protein IMZ48_29485 [Candidatus Bathyarchaeota archaeon]|nr:hypothetical protein [Candidatus Bathyarchaeota archaeon]